MGWLISIARRPRIPEWEGSAWPVLVLAEGKGLYAEPVLQREVKPHCDATARLRKLGPLWTSSERTFKHCVAVVRRRPQQRLVHLSQVAAGSIVQPMEKKQHVGTNQATPRERGRASLEGAFITSLLRPCSRNAKASVSRGSSKFWKDM